MIDYFPQQPCAIEKLRILHNAGGKWVRGDTLTAEESALLADEFPALWPNAPTQAQFDTWREGWWKTRQDATQHARTIYRRAVASSEFSYVDLDGIVS